MTTVNDAAGNDTNTGTNPTPVDALVLRAAQQLIVGAPPSQQTKIHIVKHDSREQKWSKEAAQAIRQRFFYIAMDVYKVAEKSGKTLTELITDKESTEIAQSLLDERKHCPRHMAKSLVSVLGHNWMRKEITSAEVKNILTMFSDNGQLLPYKDAENRSHEYGDAKSKVFAASEIDQEIWLRSPEKSSSEKHWRAKIQAAIVGVKKVNNR